MNRVLGFLGHTLARYLDKPSRGYEPLATSDPEDLRRTLRAGDVLLVEGNRRISVAIKYLTQSTWSHATLCIGDALSRDSGDRDPPILIEVDLLNGVCAVPLSRYERFHTRICRPVNLAPEDRDRIVRTAISRIGQTYDLKNVIDLARYLLPIPPVPVRWRRRMLALGSGEPTRAICSTLIAQLFQLVGYPILPRIETLPAPRPGCNDCVQEILHIRHYSLFAPRDFDISPFFEVVKPALKAGFDYKSLMWDRADEQYRPERPVS
jgi:hypothetical protein